MEPDSESRDLGIAILKWILLLASMPIWGPFAKALWEEFKLAMRADGGLFGPEPSRRERERLLAELEAEEPRLVHEPIAHHRERATQPAARAATRAASRGTARAGEQGAARAAAGRKGGGGRSAPPAAAGRRGFRR